MSKAAKGSKQYRLQYLTKYQNKKGLFSVNLVNIGML